MEDIDDNGTHAKKRAKKRAAPRGTKNAANTTKVTCPRENCGTILLKHLLGRHLEEHHVGTTCYFIKADGSFCLQTTKTEKEMVSHLTRVHVGWRRAPDEGDKFSCPFRGLCKKKDPHTKSQEACRCMRTHQSVLFNQTEDERQEALKDAVAERARLNAPAFAFAPAVVPTFGPAFVPAPVSAPVSAPISAPVSAYASASASAYASASASASAYAPAHGPTQF